MDPRVRFDIPTSRRQPTPRPRLLLAALGSLLAVVLAACGDTDLGQAGTAATVNDAEITVEELEQRYDEATQTPQVAQQLEADPEGTRPQLEAQLLTQLVQSQLLRQGAEELGVEVTEADIATQRERLVEQVGGEEALQGLLEENGISEDQLSELLHDLALQEKVTDHLTADLEVTDQQVQEFYEQNYGPTVSARHILVDDEAQAQAVLDRLEAGEDFAAVAEEVSTDTGSAAQGGDLGEVTRGQTVPEFEEAVFGAEPGQVVGPVETQFGFHVIEVTDRQEAPPLEEVREEVVEQVQGPERQQAVQEWLLEQVSAAEVEVNPRFGVWDAELGQVVPEDPLGTVSEVPTEPAATEPAATEPAATQPGAATGQPQAPAEPAPTATE